MLHDVFDLGFRLANAFFVWLSGWNRAGYISDLAMSYCHRRQYRYAFANLFVFPDKICKRRPWARIRFYWLRFYAFFVSQAGRFKTNEHGLGNAGMGFIYPLCVTPSIITIYRCTRVTISQNGFDLFLANRVARGVYFWLHSRVHPFLLQMDRVYPFLVIAL